MAEGAGTGHRLAGYGRLATLLVGVLLAAAACAISGTPGPSSIPTVPGSGALSSASDGPISPVVGTVSSVDPAAPASPAAPSPKKATAKPSARTPQPTASKPEAQPRGFTLLTTGGETLTFTIGVLDNPDDFPASSLYDRLTTEDPIRVFFTVEGDKLVVFHIEDAG